MVETKERNRSFPNRRKVAAFLTGLALVGAACSGSEGDGQESTSTSSPTTTEVATTTTVSEAPATSINLPNSEVIEFDTSIEYPIAYSKTDFIDLLKTLPRFDSPEDPSQPEIHTSMAIIPGVMFTLNNGDKVARPILAYEEPSNIDPADIVGTGVYGLPTYNLAKTTKDYGNVRMLYFDNGDVRSFTAVDVAIATVTARPPAYVEQGIELGPQFAQVIRVGENGLIARDSCNDPDFSWIGNITYVEIDDAMVAVGTLVGTESEFTERRGLGGVNGTCVY